MPPHPVLFCWPFQDGSSVAVLLVCTNIVMVYKRQNFLQVVVHVIIIDQCIQTALIATLFLSLWRQSAVERGLSVKSGLGHWQTVQTQISRRMRRLVWFCTVCLDYKKLVIKWNNLTSPFGIIFPAYTQRQSAHQRCQCFDCNCTGLLCHHLFLIAYFFDASGRMCFVIVACLMQFQLSFWLLQKKKKNTACLAYCYWHQFLWTCIILMLISE